MTWKMSFELVKYNPDAPLATQLLELLAFLNPDLILIDFLKAGSGGA